MTAMTEATYSRTLEIFGRTWTYDVRPVTLSGIEFQGVYEGSLLLAAFMLEEHACRYVDTMVGA